MSGFLLKEQSRIVGIDDGMYVRGSARTPIVLTLMRLDGYIDGIYISNVSTDGDDSAISVIEALSVSGFGPQTRVILSDGACLAGFNVLDMDHILRRTGIPVITCSDKKPDTGSVRSALKQNFVDWERRLSLIVKNIPVKVDLPDGACYIRYSGMSCTSAEQVVRRSTIRGRTPEPLRISHMVAHSLRKTMR